VLFGRGLCLGLMIHPQESYRVCVCLSEFDLEASIMRTLWPTGWLLRHGEKFVLEQGT